MSFRQKNEIPRKWNAFYQNNKELIEHIGLPGATIDTWERFAYLLMHGVMDSTRDSTGFNLNQLDAEKVVLFRMLVDRYFEAGFSDPGMHPALAGGTEEWVKLVKRYPDGFGHKTVEYVKDWHEGQD